MVGIPYAKVFGNFRLTRQYKCGWLKRKTRNTIGINGKGQGKNDSRSRFRYSKAIRNDFTD